MGYVIYVDIIFILNVCMDYLLLHTFGKITRKKKRRCRQIIASLLGGVGILFKIYGIFVPYFIVVLFMIMLSFPGMKRIESCKCALCFYVFSIMIGGSLLFLKEQKVINDSIWQLFAAAGGCLFFFSRGMELFLQKSRFLKNLYPVDLIFGEKTISGIALLDTGNRLYDPYFQRPVMIAEYSQVKDIYEACGQEQILWIPYHSIGKDYGMLPAIKMEKLLIHSESGMIIQNQVLAAVKKGCLSAKCEYQFILHEDLLDRKRGKVKNVIKDINT